MLLFILSAWLVKLSSRLVILKRSSSSSLPGKNESESKLGVLSMVVRHVVMEAPPLDLTSACLLVFSRTSPTLQLLLITSLSSFSIQMSPPLFPVVSSSLLPSLLLFSSLSNFSISISIFSTSFSKKALSLWMNESF